MREARPTPMSERIEATAMTATDDIITEIESLLALKRRRTADVRAAVSREDDSSADSAPASGRLGPETSASSREGRGAQTGPSDSSSGVT